MPRRKRVAQQRPLLGTDLIRTYGSERNWSYTNNTVAWIDKQIGRLEAERDALFQKQLELGALRKKARGDTYHPYPVNMQDDNPVVITLIIPSEYQCEANNDA